MSDRDRIYELISGDIDGLLDESGRAELDALLKEDPEAAELHAILSAAHAALDFEAEPPAELLPRVMEGVERENRARRAARARTVRILSGFAAAAAVLAVAILPGALHGRGSGAENKANYAASPASEAPSAGGSAASETDDAQEPATCYNPADDGALLMLPGATMNGSFTAKEFCADYLAVLYFDRLPPELADPEPVLFSDGTAGHIITQEQYEQYKDQAVSVDHPNPDGVLIMAVAPE